MSPEQYRQIGRGLLDFVPGVSTALNWPQMGPWGRGLSLGLDALDLATAGGKGGAARAFLKFLRPEDQMRYLRFGQVPLSPEGRPVASRSNVAWAPGTGNIGVLGRQEPGVSVYPSLLDPKTGKYVLKDAPAEYTMPGGHPMNPQIDPSTPWTQHPIRTQQDFIQKLLFAWQNRTGNFPKSIGHYQPFEVTGRPVSALGSDLEPLLDPASITRSRKVDPLDIVTQGNPSMALPSHALETMGAHPGMTRTVLSDIPNVSFEKYDQFGNRILNPLEQWIDWASKARLASTIPATVPVRGLQTPFNLEEQYQRQAGRRGGWSPGG
jgi:hypothetical protein